MKQPRMSDFDPTVKERGLKSSMRDFPVITPSHSPQQTSALQSAEHSHDPVPPGREVRDAQEVASASTGRRRIKPRHPFDIYEDQVETLKQLALEDRMRGGPGSQSAMVREAIDKYIDEVRQRTNP